MAKSEGQEHQETEVADQPVARDSTIFQLAQELLDEADRLARGVTEDAKREAEAETARIVREAHRRAEEIVKAASDKAKRLESEQETVKKITDDLQRELEAAIRTLAKPLHAEILPPVGPGGTWPEDHQAVKPPGLLGFEVEGQAVSPGPNATR